MSIHYFLDWRPIQAMPLSSNLAVVTGAIDYAEVRPFIGGQTTRGDPAVRIPSAHALVRARLVARSDGLFVFGLEVDDTAGLDPEDVDDLANVVSSVFKQGVLDHTPYHYASRDSGPRQRLRPSQILQVLPVRLAAGPWEACLDSGALGQDQVRAALSDARASDPAPPALAQLRRRYLGLEDTIGFRIAVHRTRQHAANDVSRYVAALFYAIVAGGLILLPLARVLKGIDPWTMPGLALTVIALAVAMHFRQTIAVWDAPVIQLLRTAHGFFISANMLNRVVEAVDLHGDGRPVDDFGNVAASLQSRLDGEQYRVALGQGWLALAVAGASLMAALAAFQATPA